MGRAQLQLGFNVDAVSRNGAIIFVDCLAQGFLPFLSWNVKTDAVITTESLLIMPIEYSTYLVLPPQSQWRSPALEL